MASLYRSLKSAASYFAAAPLHFIALQSPLLLDNAFQYFYPRGNEATPKEIIALLLISLATGFISAATLISLRLRMEGNSPSALSIAGQALRQWRVILPSALLFYALFFLGLQAFILIGLLFGATFMYVPYLIAYQPDGPVFGYFNWSRKIAARRIGPTLVFIIALILLSLHSEFSQIGFGQFLSPFLPPEMLLLITALLNAATTVVFGAMLDLWIAVYLVNLLKGEPI